MKIGDRVNITRRILYTFYKNFENPYYNVLVRTIRKSLVILKRLYLTVGEHVVWRLDSL